MMTAGQQELTCVRELILPIILYEQMVRAGQSIPLTGLLRALLLVDTSDVSAERFLLLVPFLESCADQISESLGRCNAKCCVHKHVLWLNMALRYR